MDFIEKYVKSLKTALELKERLKNNSCIYTKDYAREESYYEVDNVVYVWRHDDEIDIITGEELENLKNEFGDDFESENCRKKSDAHCNMLQELNDEIARLTHYIEEAVRKIRDGE